MTGIHLGWLLAVCACASHAAAPAPARPAGPAAACIGETFTIDSKVLGERRVINVYLPPDYAKDPSLRYPVLYMPDGGMAEDFPHIAGSVDVSIKNAVIRPVIVVGVENTDRRHDVTPPTQIAAELKDAPRAGGSETFRAFFRDELKPAIEARYRITAESALIGESLAGLFVVETFLVEPALFDGYIAVDPSLWWNEQAVVRTANERLVDQIGTSKRLYVATGDLAVMQEGAELLTSSLRILSPAGITWTYEPMPNEHHNTIFAIAGLRGIRTVFAMTEP
jgi:predicted alpha/beta superfamily hydrolase